MKNLPVNFGETDPPSVAVVMLPEVDADKLVLAELYDQAFARRCLDPAVQKQAINGRILVATLSSFLGVKDKLQVLDTQIEKTIHDLSSLLGIQPQQLLESAFVVRFFQW